MLERDVVAEIKKYLSSLGSDVFFWKEHGGPYGTSGVPDIICCYKGRFLGLEVKLPSGKLTELQKRAIAKINRAGGIACRVESAEDVRAIIARVDSNCPGHAACAFYKPRWKHEKDQQLAYCKIAALPVERQQSISQKYYKGLMPWEDVQV